MNNILEATLQIKDKNIIWDNKVQEKIFKKRKSLFSARKHLVSLSVLFQAYRPT